MEDARSVVASRIATRIDTFPDLGPTSIDVTSLEGRDAALAVAIDRAVHRRWLTLAAVLGDVARRPQTMTKAAVPVLGEPRELRR